MNFLNGTSNHYFKTNYKHTVIITLSILLIVCPISFNFQVGAGQNTLTVPDDFSTIQAAIFASSNGDTINVKAGTYAENIIVDKSISLVGSDAVNTVIKGEGENIDTITITADDASISGFTITSNAGDSGRTGLYLEKVDGCTVTDNIVSDNPDYGIAIGNRDFGSSYNTIVGNRIVGNNIGVSVADPSTGNVIYHNLITQNTIQEPEVGSGSNSWDNGYPSGGNCWGEYNGVDDNHGPGQNIPGSDGISDTQYIINLENVDRYPLYVYFGNIRQFQVNIDGQLTQIVIETNAAITEASSTLNSLSFTAGGLGGFGSGYLRAIVPSSETGDLQITIDSIPIAPLILIDGTDSYVFFQFEFSTHSIKFLFGAGALVFFGTPAINGKTVDINGGAMPGDKIIENGIDWDWGDQTAVEQHYFPNSHTYALGGSFIVTVTAHYIDESGSFTASESINVVTLPEGQKSGGFNVRIDNTVGGGSVSYQSSLGDGTVASGSYTDLYLAAFDTVWGITATPDIGRDFAQWAITGTDISFQKGYTQSSNPTVILVDSDGTIAATFIPSLQVPEYALGALIAMIACFAAFFAVKKPWTNLKLK